MATPLAEIDSHPEALVAVVFDRLDISAANGDRLAEALGHVHFTGRRTDHGGALQHRLRKVAQLLRGMRELLGHAE